MNDSLATFQQLKADGVAAYRRKEFAEAANCLQQALEIDGADPSLWELLGMVSLQNQRLHDAVDAFQHAITINPHRALSYINIGAIYNRLREYDLAIEFLQKGIQRDRRSIEGFYNLGLAYRRLGEYDLAVSALKEVLRQNPVEWEAWYQIGKIYRDQGNLMREIASYRKALEIVPRQSRVQKALAAAQQEQDDQRQQASPFGRIVESEAPRQSTSTTMLSALTPVERMEDRKIVSLCALAAEIAARELFAALIDMRPILDKLTVGVTAGTFRATAFRQTQQNYRHVARDIARKRELLQQKMAQLKVHENEVLALLERKLG
ncbi:tetratricopeptide repeat protein [Rubinisphaera margarita]|uniref:tetratricopeptide repeat protein n=1 Tax=Rubinisphaera margarita TaxID=2909586 RepID=UPI001EE8680E|nr:tetratricopeptide repeat protein [Rubinisphaera margarita]MCG6154714.1 tetratricopeptide repeat protein [Rubinisphaera margarita]